MYGSRSHPDQIPRRISRYLSVWLISPPFPPFSRFAQHSHHSAVLQIRCVIRIALLRTSHLALRTPLAANAASRPALGWARADLVVCSRLSCCRRSGRGLRGERVVSFFSLARCEAWRLVRPFLFGGGASRSTTREGCSPAPPRHIARIVPVFVPTKPLARRRGVLGLLSRLYNGSTTTTPAPKSECDARPNLGAELPLLLGAARRRWRLVVPCSSQRWLCRVPLGGVGVVPCSSQRRLLGLPSAALCCASRSPTIALGTSTPRARLVRAPLVPKVAPALPSGAGRGLKVCSSCRRCVLRASNGFPARSGATRAARPPKSERGGSVPNEFAPNLPRSLSRLWRASPPIQ